jgi:signal transduction histidine kinase/ActR/RegA family two-component response regulator
VGAVIIADEQVTPVDLSIIAAAIDRQPSWSDLPVILFCGKRLSLREGEQLSAKFNCTLLERPVSRSTLAAAVRSELRARRRQLETRSLLDRVEETNQRRADSDRRKDQFLAVLGHELRNPLSAIKMAVSAMQLARGEEAAARHRAIIERQSRNLTKLVDDLLDVSRVSRGKIQLALEPVDLNDIARRCIQALEADARLHRHALSITTPAWPVIVEVAPVRMEQVLSNLVTNAIKYTPDGGRVEIVVERAGNEARLAVRDTGIGLPAEAIPTLFDAFVQMDASLARSKGGLGLGLAVAKGIVELHRGRIGARSDGEGRGSEFEVWLPLAPAGALARGRAVALPTSFPVQGGLRISLVEDNHDARETMAEYLRVLGHEVTQAADGREGLELILAQKPDLAIVDIGLPAIDGYEVARQVRTTAELSTVLIALTGYGQPDDRKRALEAGFDVHLVKPVDLEALARLTLEARHRHETAALAPFATSRRSAEERNDN